MPSSQEVWDEKVYALREKLAIRHSAIQRSAVWNFIQSIYQEERGGEAKKEPKGFEVLTRISLRHSSPVVVHIFWEGVQWLVDQKILSMDGAIEMIVQNIDKIAESCFSRVLSLLFGFLSSESTEYSSDVIVVLIRRRSEMIGEVMGQSSVHLGSSLLLSPQWKKLLGPCISTIIESKEQEGQVYHFRDSFTSFLIDQIEILANSPSEEKNQRAKEMLVFLSERIEHLAVTNSRDFLFHMEFVRKIVSSCERLYKKSLITLLEYYKSVSVYISHLVGVWVSLHQNTLVVFNEMELESVTLSQGDTKTSSFEGEYGQVYRLREVGFLLSVLRYVHLLLMDIRESIKSYSSDPCHHKNILLLSFILLDSSETQQEQALQILDDYLIPSLTSQPLCSVFVFPRLIYPLLQTMSSPVERIKSLASKLLYRMEKFGSMVSHPSAQSNNDETPFEFTVAPIPPRGFCVKMFYLVDCSIEFYANALREGDLTAELLRYMDDVCSQMEEQSIHQFLLFWMAPFLFHGCSSVRQKTCSLIQRISELQTESCIGLLPFLMYQSEKENDADTQMQILRTIPYLACHSHMLPPIFRALSPLLRREQLCPFALRLLCRVWKKQDRSFRKFQKILIEHVHSPSEPIRIAVGICIRDICKERPTRGRDFITLISEMIKASHELLKCCALESLTYLCIADCVDFTTAWKIIQNDVMTDDRSLVMEHRMRLFEAALQFLDIENEECIFHLQQLWQGVHSPHANVRKAAYDVLLAFYEKNSACIPLLRERGEHLKAIMDRDDISSPSGVLLGKKVLLDEVGLSRRQIELATESNTLYNSLGRLGDYLENMYVESKRPALSSGLAGGNLWFYVPSVTKKSSSTAHGELLVQARAYRLKMNELIQDVFMNTWTTRLIGLFGWIRFSGAYFRLLIQAEKAKYQVELENAPQDQPPAERDYYKETMAILRDYLHDKRVINPAVSENCVMALAGFTLALPASKHDLIESNMDFIQDMLFHDEKSNEREQFACILSLACLCSLLPLSEFQRVKSIYERVNEFVQRHAENEWFLFASSLAQGIIASTLLQKLKVHMQSDSLQGNISFVNMIRDSFIERMKCESFPKDSKAILGVCLALNFFVSSYSDGAGLLQILKQTEAFLESEKKHTRSIFLSGISLSYVATLLRCFRLHLITKDKMKHAIETLKALAFPQSSSQGNLGACIALGSLIQGSLLYGYVCSQREIENVVTSFVCLASSDKLSDSLRESCLLGLANVLGANLLVPLDGSLSLAESTEFLFGSLNRSDDFCWSSTLSDNLKAILESSSNSTRLSSFAAWILGSLARPLPPQSFSSSTSSLLKQLPEGSLLKALLLQLQSNTEALGSSGEKGALCQELVHILDCLCEVPARKLPLIDWVPMLQQLVHGEMDIKVRAAGFRFAIHNGSNPAVEHLLSCSLEIGDFVHLPAVIRFLFLRSIPTLVQSMPTQRSIQLLRDHSSLILESLHEWKRTNLRDISAESLEATALWVSSLAQLLGSGKISASLQTAAKEVFILLLQHLPLPIVEAKGTDYPYHVNIQVASLFSFIARESHILTDAQVNEYFSFTPNEYSELNIKSSLWVALLVKEKRIPLSRLHGVRNLFFSHPDISFSSLLLLWLHAAVQDVSLFVQRTWYRDCVDCFFVFNTPLLVLRFIGWISLFWSSPELTYLLIPGIGVTNIFSKELFNQPTTLLTERMCFLSYSIERVVPYTLPSLLLRFAKEQPSENTMALHLSLLRNKLSEIHSINSECAPVIASVLANTISLLQSKNF